MADERTDFIDLSTFVKDITFQRIETGDTAIDDAALAGLKSSGPITISGYFDSDAYICGLCHQRTARQESGDPMLVHDSLGYVEVCGDCLMGLIDAGVVSLD